MSISNINYNGDTTIGATIDKSKFTFTVTYSNGTTNTVTGATSVNPTTIASVGNNSVKVNYTENGTTVSVTATIVGTEESSVVNLFDKNDPDVHLTGRINSSGNAVNSAEGQLVTGFIDAKVGDVFTIKADKSVQTNNYTGMAAIYKSDKTYIRQINRAQTEMWEWPDQGVNGDGILTITSTVEGNSNADTALVRFCIAYTDIDSIIITKA